MRKLLLLIVTIAIAAGCTKRILSNIKKSQLEFMKGRIIDYKSGDMLNSFQKSRKHICNIYNLGNKLQDNDTIFMIEGFSVVSGMTYSTIWSRKLFMVNYKSHFGRNVEVVEYNLFEEPFITAISQWNFSRFEESNHSLDGNIYLISCFVTKNKRIYTIKHELLYVSSPITSPND